MNISLLERGNCFSVVCVFFSLLTLILGGSGCTAEKYSDSEIASEICREGTRVGKRETVTGIISLSTEGAKIYSNIKHEKDIFSVKANPILLDIRRIQNSLALKLLKTNINRGVDNYTSFGSATGVRISSPKGCGLRQEYSSALIVETIEFKMNKNS